MGIKCSKCGSEELWKSGKTKYGTQLYLCKDCKHHGTMTGGIKIKGKNQGKCRICNHPAIAKGLCSKHYHQEYTKKKKEEKIPCKLCSKPAVVKGYCATHYSHSLLRSNEAFGITCELCNSPVFAKGLCRKHYREDLKRRKDEERLN